jgi:hypothetical protein
MLKTRMRMRYREIVEIVSMCPDIMMILKIPKVPHYTTLHKFFMRIGSFLLEKLFSKTVKLFETESPWIAIDSTGYSSGYASRHYETLDERLACEFNALHREVHMTGSKENGRTTQRTV